MNLRFNPEDLEQLQRINERELYRLNRDLLEVTNEIKRFCMSDEQLICKLVALTETAAKEVACRKRWSPKPSNDRYSTNGITYDTEEYRKWLRDMSFIVPDEFAYNDFLGTFSFGIDVLELMRG